MRRRNIVIGQKMHPDKVKRARMLRRQITEEERIPTLLRNTLSPPRLGEGPGEGSLPRLFRVPRTPTAIAPVACNLCCPLQRLSLYFVKTIGYIYFVTNGVVFIGGFCGIKGESMDVEKRNG